MKKMMWAVAPAIALTAAAAVSSPAFAAVVPAEGSFTSSLTLVQPTFESRTWTDAGSDTKATIVTLSGCEETGPDGASLPLNSVELTLYRNGGVVSKIKQACGSYNFGDAGAGQYYFVVSAINGDSSADRTHFLSASSVTVSY